jgi:hypothetical protein
MCPSQTVNNSTQLIIVRALRSRQGSLTCCCSRTQLPRGSTQYNASVQAQCCPRGSSLCWCSIRAKILQSQSQPNILTCSHSRSVVCVPSVYTHHQHSLSSPLSHLMRADRSTCLHACMHACPPACIGTNMHPFLSIMPPPR